ncbi:MAG: hypothetical protein M3401_12360, partial [Actinomycetota bacterium]|nr:hypothetical protein [Actinomycetota bacterium]
MLLSGFGVAGCVLGAVVAAFALASAVVGFGVWPGDPANVEQGALTVGPTKLSQSADSRDAAPLVLSGSDTERDTARADAARADTAAAASTAGTGSRTPAQR